jgi:hypothetical protein
VGPTGINQPTNNDIARMRDEICVPNFCQKRFERSLEAPGLSDEGNIEINLRERDFECKKMAELTHDKLRCFCEHRSETAGNSLTFKL